MKRILAMLPVLALAACADQGTPLGPAAAAPVLARSAWWTSDTAFNTQSGTSMASPHVAGVAARLLHAHGPIAPSTLAGMIAAAGTPGRIRLHSRSLAYGTPNLLLYTRI